MIWRISSISATAHVVCKWLVSVLVPVLCICFTLQPTSYVPLHSAVHSTLRILRASDIYRRPHRFPPPPFALFSTKVILPNSQQPQPAYILVNEHGKIEATPLSLLRVPSPFRATIVDVAPLIVMPGLVDPHVHVNSPGRDDWEGFASATRAAAAGGTTTILDMPINSMPATVDAPSLSLKFTALSQAEPVIDVGLIGGVVPNNAANLSDLIRGGVIALKSFLVDSQSPDFQMVEQDHLQTAVAFLQAWNLAHHAASRIPYILHAELDSDAVRTSASPIAHELYDHTSYTAFESTRPPSWETSAVRNIIAAINGSKVHAHIAHVSAIDVVHLLQDTIKTGLYEAHITAETCPHYLVFAADEIPTGSTLFKCAPPIRSANNRAALVNEVFVKGGTPVVTSVVSDHSPCVASMKETNGNLTAAWGGIAGLQYRLGATWRAARTVGASVVDVSRVLSENPARTFALDEAKGALAAGRDADVVVWDAEGEETVNPERCEHRVKRSAFDEWKLPGSVKYTLIRGQVIFVRGGDGIGEFTAGAGRLLLRREDGSLEQRTP